jgi:AraC-like DNA-binding protein
VPGSRAGRHFVFKDSDPYGRAIRNARIDVLVAEKGEFHAELTQVDLPRLWLQRGCENLARVFHSSLDPRRAAIVFLADTRQRHVQCSGLSIAPGDIIVAGRGAVHYHRTFGPCRWATMSLAAEDFVPIGQAVAGRELTVPTATHALRPPAVPMARLLALHREVGQLALRTPETLAHPEVARALEQALLHLMITCLTEGASLEMTSSTRRHSAIIARLEEVFAANPDRPLHLVELCAAVGVSERTLRACCQEHLGMGPVHYLWLRRMHLAHRALKDADPETASVTGIATSLGFCELGRFAVDYRAMFGEPPSASLRRPPEDTQQHFSGRPFAVPLSESA